jgi:hypothetical protein
MSATLASSCTICDAPPGDCSHRATRYLEEPIVYTQVFNEQGEPAGWRVPDHERKRWDNPVKAPKPAPIGTTPRELPGLLADLDASMWVDSSLRIMLNEAYEVDQLRTTRAVESVLPRIPSLTSPAGVLVNYLKEIVSG